MDNGIKYLVRVDCMTYNQASYIEDAMNGFCMQQTGFPFLCIIVDDASTDGEPDVIKNYIDDNFDRQNIGLSTPDETDEYVRIYARHKENKNCYFCVLLLKYNHYSIRKAKLTNIAELIRSIKYIAMCEGDDYWTDPLKLQKQVDFLEEHEEYVMCCHRYKLFFQESGTFENDYVQDLFDLNPGGFTFGHKETVMRLISHTATVVFRRDVVDPIEFKKKNYKYSKDVHHVYHLLLKGKGYYFPFYASVYRKHKGGVWSRFDKTKAYETYHLVYQEILDKNPDDNDLKIRILGIIENDLHSSARIPHWTYVWIRTYLRAVRKTDGFFYAFRKGLLFFILYIYIIL